MKKLTKEEVIENFIKTHNNKYDYSLVEYVNSRTKVKIICPEHGIFEQHVNNHIRGEGCPSCGKLNGRRKKTNEEFIKEAIEIHGDRYDYSKTNYKDALSKLTIICKKHGEFEQIANEHLKGKNCEKCSYEERSFNKRIGSEELYDRLISVHNNKYILNKEEINNYINTQKEFITITCKKHGEFIQRISNHLNGQGCPKCAVLMSKAEDEIIQFLKPCVNTIQRYKTNDKKEIDILIPSLNIGIEYNGLRWHSEQFGKDKNYHLNKTLQAEKEEIKLIHIFEDEWIYKKEIVKSRLLNLIGKTPNKIYARKCEIREISYKESSKFLETNHIQGNVVSKYRIGLFYNNELVSLMTFGGLRRNLGSTSEEGKYELLRFCNKLNTTIIGGASKLLFYFEKTYKPKEIISYADRRWSEGNLYKQLKFEFVSNSSPNYFYINNNKRENRFKYRKSELIKIGFDKNKTEKQIMEEEGFYRIYDCGTIKFSKVH